MTTVQNVEESEIPVPPEPAKVRIVVIENSPHDTWLIKEAVDLWTRPFELACFTEGSAAIAELRQPSPNDEPVLILLDWNLPGMHGSKVLRQLRSEANLPKCFVVVFTSSSADADKNMARSLGADLFLTKAVNLDDFFYSIVSLQQLV
jgi:CheY-like chemotaxis protein